MTPSIKLAMSIIEKFEGFSAKAYVCPAGVETIGYGFTEAGVPQIQPFLLQGYINVEDADMILQQLCEKIAHEIVDTDNYGIGNIFTDNELASLISFVFNIGITRFFHSTLWKVTRANPKDYENIEKQFNRWIYGNGKVLKGLLNRRKQEFKLYKGEN